MHYKNFAIAIISTGLFICFCISALTLHDLLPYSSTNYDKYQVFNITEIDPRYTPNISRSISIFTEGVSLKGDNVYVRIMYPVPVPFYYVSPNEIYFFMKIVMNRSIPFIAYYDKNDKNYYKRGLIDTSKIVDTLINISFFCISIVSFSALLWFCSIVYISIKHRYQHHRFYHTIT